jgi:hypothetical protein
MIDAINQNFRQQESEARRKVITDEDGVDRILIGREETGGYVIKVSGEGKDVNRATPDELVMSSEWDLWKIINHGSIVALPADITRSSTLTLNSSNIAYVCDVMIKIDDIYGNTEDIITSGYSGNLQAFVRDASTRMDLNHSTNMYNNFTYNIQRQECYFVTPGGWLTIRIILKLVSGSGTITPRNYLSLNAYWAIANPSRVFVGGMGGGGTPTGQNVYWDYTIYNGSSEPIVDAITAPYTDTIEPGEFGTTYSTTWQLDTAAQGYLFNQDTLFLVARAIG